MTGNKNTFQKLQAKVGTITFGNDNSSKVLGKGTVTLGSKNATTKDVLLIENMRHNLLSVSQICMLLGVLEAIATNFLESSLLILDEIKKVKCCLEREDESWLWQRRMGHIHFGNLIKISKHQVVREMPEMHKPKTSIGESCQHGKQTRV